MARSSASPTAGTPDTDPVGAVATRLDVRRTTPGPLFTSLRGRRGSDPIPGDPITSCPITGGTVARILKSRAEAVGLPSAPISGHSLRAGHVTRAAMASVGVDRIAAQTRHGRIDVLIEHYIRPIDALQTTSSRDLDL